jgi:glutamate synthase domain-containing protein 2/glutamate synthase domain-containing protein 1
LGYHVIKDMVEKDVTPSVAKILSRFNIAPRSFGSISPPAHVAGAIACNTLNMMLQRKTSIDQLDPRMGPYQSSGEGGEHPSRYGTLAASLDHQIASGRWGAGLEYITHAKKLGIKVSQGVKPGQGGHLPAEKNTPLIGETRGTPPGINLISPPPHHDIYSIEDLAALIRDLRVVNPAAAISVKLTARQGIGLIAAGAAKCGANDVKITGYGATAAAMAESKYNFATGVHYGVKEAHDALVSTGMRELVTISASGRLQTPDDVLKAVLLGADNVSFGTGPMLALGCVKVDRCHDGSCPTGIATMDPARIASFQGKPEHVVRWLIAMAKSVDNILAKYGAEIDEVVGRRDMLQTVEHGVYTNLDKMLVMPQAPSTVFPVLPPADPVSYTELSVISKVRAGNKVIESHNKQSDRTLGGRLAALSLTDPQIAAALAQPGGVHIKGTGVGGSSFGMCAPPGLTLSAPRANHFVGKSLDGGSILVDGAAGDSLFYGAQAGFGFVRGAKHRFGVRSCCDLVTEVAGPMAGCYRTGGHLAVLGTPACYEVPGSFVPDYVPPFVNVTEEQIVGPGIGGGMTGGKLVLPKRLDAQLRARDYYASGADSMLPRPLAADPTAVEWLLESLTNIGEKLPATHGAAATSSSMPAALLQLYRDDPARFLDSFVVMDPAVKAGGTFGRQADGFVPWVNGGPGGSLSTPAGAGPALSAPPPQLGAASTGRLAAATPSGEGRGLTGATESDFGSELKLAAAFDVSGTQAATVDLSKDSEAWSKIQKEEGACGLFATVEKSSTASHALVRQSIESLTCLAHRNGATRDPKTTDGFGVAFHGTSPQFWAKAFGLGEQSLAEGGMLADPEAYMIVPVFVPPAWERDGADREKAVKTVEALLGRFGHSVGATRELPVNWQELGMLAQEADGNGMMPIMQFLVCKGDAQQPFSNFTIDLERFAAQFDYATCVDGTYTHVPHVLSASPWVVYKGFTPPSDFTAVFTDMADPDFVADAAVGHGRFATNSQPTLQSVQPTRFFVHNGEVNNAAQVDVAMTSRNFSEYLGLEGDFAADGAVQPDIKMMDKSGLKMFKRGGDVKFLSDSYKCSVWHGYRRWLVAEQNGGDLSGPGGLTLTNQMMSVVPAKNSQGGVSWRALENLNQPFIETGPSARINMGMPGQPELMAAATDANHFRPLEAYEDGERVSFSSEYIDFDAQRIANGLSTRPWLFGTEGILTIKREKDAENKMQLAEGVLPSNDSPEFAALVAKFAPPPSKEADVGTYAISRHGDGDVEALKRVVGWNHDTETFLENMIGKGTLTLESMGYPAPTNPGVPGFRLDIGGLIKSKFSQVTSPPLAYAEEGKHYMSLQAVVGPHILSSPVLADRGLVALMSSTALQAHTIDTTFIVNGGDSYDLDIKAELERVVQTALDTVDQSPGAKHQLLLLSDLTLAFQNTALPMNFVVSLLDQRLRALGLRENTSIVCQSVTTLLPRDLAQLAAMGADAVHPVMPLDPRAAPESTQMISPEQRASNVVAVFEKGLNLFMACVGVSHFKAYHGCRDLWYAEGLDPEVAGEQLVGCGNYPRAGGERLKPLAP